MNYFKDCKDQEEAKSIYRKLAMKLHPDLGGSDELMRILTNQYEIFQSKTYSTSTDNSKWGKSNWSDQFEWQQAFKKTQHQRQEKVDIRNLQKQIQDNKTEISSLNSKIYRIERERQGWKDEHDKVFKDLLKSIEDKEKYKKEVEGFENFFEKSWKNSSFWTKIKWAFLSII